MCAGVGSAVSQTVDSIIVVPTLGGSMVSPEALNQQGQVVGVSTLPGDMFQRPFLYGGGVMTDLGTLGGTQSRATDLNDRGDVVGDSSTANDLATHAFLFSQGSIMDLGTLGGSYSSAVAVNDSGFVAGNSYVAGNVTSHAFLYAGAGLVDLGTLGGSYSTAVDINAAGDVAGDAYTAGDAGYHPFLYQQGVMIDLGTLGGAMAFSADLNDAGEVVGESDTDTSETHAFLHTGGSMMDLGTLGGTYSSASAVNDLGEVIGFSSLEDESIYHAFLHTGGVMLDLGTLGGPYSFANALNNRGQVVGDADDVDEAMRAFLWENGVMTDLNDLLPDGSLWDLWSALHINDAGQVMGLGLYDGQFAWFLLQLPGGNQPPVADAGPDQDLSCAGTVLLDGTASQDPDGDPLTYEWHVNGALVGQSAMLGLSLGNGVHTFTLIVTDPDGASDQDDVIVTIVDRTAPVVVGVPDRVDLVAGDDGSATLPDLTGLVQVADNCAAQLAFVQQPAPGAALAPGDHAVTVVISDEAGNAVSVDVLVHVASPCGLVVHGASATPDVLQPANHQMIQVTFVVDAESTCGDGLVESHIVGVTSSQDPIGKGDDTLVDWEVTGALTLDLRAEVAAGTDERVYVVTIECVDANGNTATVQVEVVASRGMKLKNDQTAAASSKTNQGKKQ